MNVMFLAEVDKLPLRKKRVPFDLVRSRVDTGRIVDALDVLDAEVRDTNGFDLAGRRKLQHRLPGLGQRRLVDNEDLIFLGVSCEELAGRERDGPVDDYGL